MRTFLSRLNLAILPMLLLADGGITCGQSLEQGKKDEDVSRRLRYYQQAAGEYEVTLGRDGERDKLEFRRQPVMRWLSLDTFNGAVFVWTRQNRPELAGTIFSFSKQNAGSRRWRVVHEFFSFSSGHLNVSGPEIPPWQPKPMENLMPIPGAPIPAKSERLRQLQCRALAKKFSGHMNSLGERWELRLLPKPIYTYETETPEPRSGALFAFVAYVTDPEVLLLIESRSTPNGPKWFFQPARFSDKSLWLKFNDKPIWESLRHGNGTTEPDTPDPQYRVLRSDSIAFDPKDATSEK